MQRKKLLSACIAIALASPAWSAERVEEVDQSTQIGCPSDMDNLSDSERKGLPAECQRSNMAPWVALGVTSLATAIAITELAGDNDSHHHHSSTPPDDDNVIPPDDGGDVTPPDDGGNVTPPDDGGDVTPPDDGGDVTPPDDGGDVTPPDDGGDVTPPVKFNNNVEWDKTKNTLTIRSVVFTYSQNSDGTYTLTSPDGKTVTVNDWQVDEANNTIQIDGNNAAVNIDWRYDDDGQLYITKKDTAVVNDDTHTLTIKVNDAVITDKGGNTVENGATVMDVSGNNITVNNDGDSVVTGKDSIIAVLTGNYITINNNGNTIVDGGTASTITGDHATLNNHGDVTTSNGGMGARIEGDSAVLDNIGNIIADGQGSVSTEIIGNDALVKQEGDLTVSGGAKGTVVTGNSAKITNKGKMSVTDADSVGILVDGDNTFFSNTGDIGVSNAATGISINGDSGNIALAGNMNVGDLAVGLNVSGDNNKLALATDELNVTGQKATGVKVAGDGNTIAISGNILVDKDETAADAVTNFSETSVGVNVNGNNNSVKLDGSLTVVSDSEVTTRQAGRPDGSQEDITGLAVQGDGNTVTLDGGIHLIGESGQLVDGTSVANGRTGYGQSSIINVDGHSTVYLNGDSSVSGDFPIGYSGLIQLSNGGMLEISEGATFNTDGVNSFEHFGVATPPLVYVQSGSQLTNNGDIDLSNMVFANVYNEGSTAVNNGSVTISQNSQDPMPSPAGFIALYGSSATNNGTITGKVMEQGSVLSKFSTGTSNWYLFNNDVSSITGMEAYSGSTVTNSKSGIINMYGRGDVGMLAIIESSVQNAGQIMLDTLWVDENDTTLLRPDLASKDAIDYGAGMAVGTDGYGGTGSNATATNQEGGVITVYNAGAGMAAYGAGNTVTNQGTINLEKNANYDENLGANKLVGMAVYKGGTAINDKTGVININAEIGQAFYNDGTGTIINYGTICTFSNCQSPDQYNPTDSAVSEALADGAVLSSAGDTRTLTAGIIIDGDVTNAGTVSGGSLQIFDGAKLVNESTGSISSSVKVTAGGALSNDGVLNTVSLSGGSFTNNGTLNGTVTAEKNSDAVINNTGTLSTVQLNDGTLDNSGIAAARVNAQGDAVFNNLAGGEARKGAVLYNSAVVNNAGTMKLGNQNEGNNAGTLDIDDTSVFNNSGKIVLDNSKNAIHFQGGSADATLYNTGEMTLDAAIGSGAIHYDSGASQFINDGKVDAKVTVAISTADATADDAFLWNQDNGVINFDADNSSAVKFTHSNYVALNDGIMNISGNNAVAMEGDKNAQLVNNGTINLGTSGTTDTGMIGMQLDANATADAVVENNGTINIYANDSYAFSVLGSNGHVVNNGTVVIADGVTGSGLIKQGDSVNVEGVNGNNGNTSEVHYTNYTLPNVPGSDPSPVSGDMNSLNGYVVGTNADGSAGKLKVNNASMDGVSVNTNFAAGTADTSVTFDNVVEGNNLTNAGAITSTSVVWSAQGSNDASGNVDVTMTKNAYTDVATDSSVNGVAQALDAGYTNNELYSSLNVGTTAELNSALKQISGSQATTVFREARVLSNRFSMLADAAPTMGNGLAFNVVAKGDPRAELGNDTQYDMMALRKSLALTESQNLSLEYGIARLDGDGSEKAGDNGVTGGYSQFFGLKHQMTFENGLNWNNGLRYDVHQLDSSRSVSYNGVNKTADTDVKQQYLEFRSEGAKTFTLSEGLKITPYAGVKLRHTLEDGYQERNAGDFNLNMNNGSETAVDSIVGMKLDYAGKNGWSASMTLEGGPNLSYAKSQRSATLAGAGSQRFDVDDGQKGGGINSLASVGVKYNVQDSAMHLDAYQWKEDGISDKGFMLNFKQAF